jgi:hypothetical protein
MKRRDFLKMLPTAAAIPLIKPTQASVLVTADYSDAALYYEDTDWVDPEYNPNAIENWRIIWAQMPFKPPRHPHYLHRLWADSESPQFKFEFIINRPPTTTNTPHHIHTDTIKGNRLMIARAANCGLGSYNGMDEKSYQNMLKAMDRWLHTNFRRSCKSGTYYPLS